MERETRIVKLARSIEAHGETLEELEIREPLVVDLEKTDRAQGEIGKANQLLSACAQIPIPSVRALKLSDWNRAMEALAEMGFTQPSTEDGA